MKTLGQKISEISEECETLNELSNKEDNKFITSLFSEYEWAKNLIFTYCSYHRLRLESDSIRIDVKVKDDTITFDTVCEIFIDLYYLTKGKPEKALSLLYGSRNSNELGYLKSTAYLGNIANFLLENRESFISDVINYHRNPNKYLTKVNELHNTLSTIRSKQNKEAKLIKDEIFKEAESKLMYLITRHNFNNDLNEIINSNQKKYQEDEINCIEFNNIRQPIYAIKEFMNDYGMGEFISDYSVTKSGKTIKFNANYVYSGGVTSYKKSKRNNLSSVINRNTENILSVYDSYVNYKEEILN